MEIPPPAAAPLPQTPDPFARGRQLLSGIDAPATDNGWRVGDQVLFGLQVFQGGKEELRYARITVRTPVLNPGQKVIVGDLPRLSDRRPDTLYLPHVDVATARDRQNAFAGVNWNLKFSLRSPRGEQKTITYESKLLLLGIELFDADLKRISTSHALAPESCLRRGLFPLASELLALRQRLGPNIRQVIRNKPDEFTVTVDRLSDIISTMFALRDTLWSAPALVPILESTVQKPSLWSILLKGGVNFSIQPRYQDVALEQRPLPAAAALVRGTGVVPAAGHTGNTGVSPVPTVMGGAGVPPVPMASGTSMLKNHTGNTSATRSSLGNQPILLAFDVLLNNQPCSHCQISVAPAQPPLQPSAGIIAFDVRHPTDSARRLHLRVLAARRGAAPSLQ